jgi:hypothetical protein
MILLSLLAAHSLLCAKLPEKILQIAGEDSAAVRLAQESQARIFLNRRRRENFRFVRFQLRTKSRWAERIQFCYCLAVTPMLYEPDLVMPRLLIPFYRLGDRLRHL